MRVYFLVEGRSTETKVYKAWLSHLVPELIQVPRFDDFEPNSYFLLSAEGYPSIINDHIPNSIADINRIGGYDYFVVCLDADEGTVQERINEINNFLFENNVYLAGAQLRIIVQNRCIETWFLGNRRIVRRRPENPKLQAYLLHYNIVENDPERMEKHGDFNTHAQFHFQFLREIFNERKIRYSKQRPCHVLERPFLEELLARVKDEPAHLVSFQQFLYFCSDIKKQIETSLNP